ncbi:carnitine O-palmitoyltransferase 1, liver isoform-like [Babylonia areolata]|uniref:carnitine O-palmitoyltransferase 1, liver isoform-like n=1 Tax=Babylonia areolata TaxID=304850 RepID=UPI003FD1F1ED
MAEARNMVAMETDEGHTKQYQYESDLGSLWHETYILWMRTAKRRYYRIRNLIRNGVWPTSLWNLSVAVVGLTVVQLYQLPLMGWLVATLTWVTDHLLPLPQGTPQFVKVVVTSFVTGLIFFIILLYFRRYLLRVLLAYRGWMYEPPRKQSGLTLMWGAMVRVVTGSHPTLYSYQRSLPRLSVPPLKQTVQKLMASLEPLYMDQPEEFATLQQEAEEFQATVGPTLQKALIIKSWLSPNYVSDWWEKYVYLMGRSPLPINSNYYIMDQCNWSPTYSQSSRGATMLHQLLTCKQQIERQSFEPLVIRNTIPICMAQYERIFSTTRVPGEEMDTLVHYDMLETKHVVVYCNGVMYTLEVYDSHRRLLPPQTLQKQLQWIIDDAQNYQGEYTQGQRSIPALTTLDRTAWWRIRKDHFATGVNRDSLHAVESAILFVNLDTHSFDFKDVSGRASYLLHGDGHSVWFDKSCCIFIFKDGKMGMNCEHSFADAPVVAHTMEYNMVNEVLQGLHDEQGRPLPLNTPCSTQCRNPTRLIWEVDSVLENHISHALTLHQQNIDDLDLQVHDHDNFGKGFIKTCKVSPDAFIQMALQATYLKNAGKLALTYEAAMTRLYLQGRTETVRSLTTKASAFARAFVNNTVSNADKRRLLREACDHHQVMYKDAMNGKAIDRHLFALYVASRGMGYDCEFLKKVLSIPWTLSTSQQPQQQIATAPNCNEPQYYDMLSPGGGFGPVSNDGYGVSYMIPGERRIFFHVSSKRSHPGTDSKRFMAQLFETMQDLKTLFEEEGKEGQGEEKGK